MPKELNEQAASSQHMENSILSAAGEKANEHTVVAFALFASVSFWIFHIAYYHTKHIIF